MNYAMGLDMLSNPKQDIFADGKLPLKKPRYYNAFVAEENKVKIQE